MKTITILLSFVVNDHNIVHLADYQTNFADCYQAEQAALDQALKDYIDTGKAHTVMVESCVSQVAQDEVANSSELVSNDSQLSLGAQ